MLFILGAMYAGYKVADKAGIIKSIPVTKEQQAEKSMVDFGPAPRSKRYILYEAVPYRNLNSKSNTNIDQNAIYIGNNDKVNDISLNNVYDDMFNDDHEVNIENNAIDIDKNAINIEKNTIYFKEMVKNIKNNAGHARKIKLKGKPSAVEFIRIITKSRGKTRAPMKTPVNFIDDPYLSIFRNMNKDSRKNPGKYSKIRKLQIHHKEYIKALFKYFFV